MSRWTPEISEALSLLAIVVVAVLAFRFGSDWIGAHNAEEQCKAQLQTIQIALERYRADRRTYPARLQDLVDNGFLTSMPRNPYWKAGAAPRIAEHMHETQPGEHRPGAVGYITASDSARASYLLIVYGDERACRGGRTMSGASVALSPALAGQAKQVAWDYALLMLDASGLSQQGEPRGWRKGYDAERDPDAENREQTVPATFATGNQ